MINYRKWLIDDLQRLEQKRFSIGHMESELETLKTEMGAIKATNLDKMPAGNETPEDRLITAIAKKEELEKNLLATRQHIADMESLLKQLSDDERRVIDRMIIHRERNAADDLAEELGYTNANIYKLRNKAIESMAVLRFGIGYRP